MKRTFTNYSQYCTCQELWCPNTQNKYGFLKEKKVASLRVILSFRVASKLKRYSYSREANSFMRAWSTFKKKGYIYFQLRPLFELYPLLVCLTLSTLGKNFSRRHFEILFLFTFPRKQNLAFNANYLRWR